MPLNPLRMKLPSIRLDRTILQRRSGIMEGALLLMSAYIASNVLGVVRQTILNALFGTGPEANAFYAAAQLPNTLFNLIAGGALTYAFIKPRRKTLAFKRRDTRRVPCRLDGQAGRKPARFRFPGRKKE